MRVTTDVFRGGKLESTHTIEAVVVDDAGHQLFRTHHPEYQTYVRSSAKPFQAYPLIHSGAAREYHLTLQEIAVCCASHNGESIHIDTVRDIQQRAGLSENDLMCGSHLPYDETSANALIRQHADPTPIYNNCSGKHTGMLLASLHQGFPLENYVDRNHPLQQQIVNFLEKTLNRHKIHTGIDGCSVPTFYLSLTELARLFQLLASGEEENLAVIYDAMTSEPYLVAGHNRFDTDFMQAMKGAAVSKVGAEGVRGIGIRVDGKSYGLALKVLDGAKRASASAALEILKITNLLSVEISRVFDSTAVESIFNHAGLRVGEIRTTISP